MRTLSLTVYLVQDYCFGVLFKVFYFICIKKQKLGKYVRRSFFNASKRHNTFYNITSLLTCYT